MEPTQITVAMPKHIEKLMETKIKLEGELWGISEIALFLGLKNNTVSGSIVNKDENPSFPEAITLSTGGRRWIAKEVKAWAFKRR